MRDELTAHTHSVPLITAPESLNEMAAPSLRRLIQHLKREIGRTRRDLETRIAGELEPVPVADLLAPLREQLQAAISAYRAVGGQYQLSRAEVTAQALLTRLAELIRIELNETRFIGERTVTVDFVDQVMFYTAFPEPLPDENHPPAEQPIDTATVLAQLELLHIEEWRRNYEHFGTTDGLQWQLKLEFKTGRPVNFQGYNAYPYNYDELSKLFGLSQS